MADEYIKRKYVLECIKESRDGIDWGQSEDGDAFLHYSACLYRTMRKSRESLLSTTKTGTVGSHSRVMRTGKFSRWSMKQQETILRGAWNTRKSLKPTQRWSRTSGGGENQLTGSVSVGERFTCGINITELAPANAEDGTTCLGRNC